MIKRLLAGSFTFILILGVLAVALTKYFNINVSFLEWHADYGIGMYTYNVYGYVNNLQDNLDSILTVQVLQTPTYALNNWSSLENMFKTIANWFVNSINTIIFLINMILATIKIGFYVIIIIMCLFGINTADVYIYNIAITFYQLNLEYIPPIQY